MGSVIATSSTATGSGSGGSTTAGSGGSGGSTTTGSGGSGGAPFMPAMHPPFPVVQPNDGSELIMPRLVVIVAPDEPLADQLFAFGDALVQSAWLETVGHDYGIAATAGAVSVHLTGAAVAATMDETDLRAYVAATIAANPVAAADGHTIYLFVYPPGANPGDSCSDIGSHSVLVDAPYQKGMPVDSLAWVQRCPTPMGMTELAGLTIAASHEIIESATDAYPPHGFAMPSELWPQTPTTTPWDVTSWAYFQSGAVEVADLCQGTVVDEGSTAFQRIWSTTAAAVGGDPCVPALAAPYYSVATLKDWITVPAGSTAMVPITGWSTGPRGDWFVTVRYADTTEGGFTPTFAGGAVTASVNNGVTAMLSVTTPSAPGAFVVFQLQSSESPPDSTTGLIPEPAGGDLWHTWAFGIHTTCVGCTEAPTCGDGTCDTSTGETCASCPDDCGACGAVCGASNLSVACGAISCPTNSTCEAGDTCNCNAGFVANTCDGEACSGLGCVSPSWWCAPAACGTPNFTAPCGSGFCPSSALCTPDLRCLCSPGTQTATCNGQPCPSGGCSYPDYWCTTCGTANSTVKCSDGTTCPSFSTCVVGNPTTCDCQDGFRAATCAGESCSDVDCPGPDWWCIPN